MVRFSHKSRAYLVWLGRKGVGNETTRN
jgi:hypothetical protein